MLIFDGDYPMAFGALEINRDLTLPLEEVRAAEEDTEVVAMASLPELRRARVAAALVKFTVRRLRRDSVASGTAAARPPTGRPRGRWPTTTCWRSAGGRHPDDREGPVRHMDRWEGGKGRRSPARGLHPRHGGRRPLLWPDQVHEWWDDGVRVVSLTHYGPSTYAWGTGTEGGLKEPPQACSRKWKAAACCST